MYPVADVLKAAGTPFFFATAYAASEVIKDFPKGPILRKPYREADVLRVLAEVLEASSDGSAAQLEWPEGTRSSNGG